MAGGPSTPALVDALSRAGGLGFLAGGYKSREGLLAEIQSLSTDTFGVNIFCQEDEPLDEVALLQYGKRINPIYRAHGMTPPNELSYIQVDASDAVMAKYGVLYDTQPAVCSMTFGMLPSIFFEILHERGLEIWVTVTSPADAKAAEAAGADAVILQGIEAGGHRSTFRTAILPDQRTHLELLRATKLNIPIIAAGGITTAEHVRAALDAGATAVCCGTAFLLADEAGTSELHRRAIKEAQAGGGRTELTRAYSGRIARAIETEFMREHRDALAAYPHIHKLMSPLRKNTTDLNYVAAWAGVNFAEAVEAPAEEIVRKLMDF